MRVVLPSLCALIVLQVGAGLTRADEDPAALAHHHFEEAERLFDAAQYEEARKEYVLAYEAKPHPNVLFNIAVAYERIYKPKRAREYYERFLHDLGAGGDESLVKKARARLHVLENLPGSIVISTSRPGASAALHGLGRDVTAGAPHTFEDLPPGDYRLHVEAPDYVPVDLTQHLEPGEQVAINLPLEHQQGLLTVLTIPEGARVFVDGKEEGATPFSRPIDTGLGRSLRLESEGFLPFDERVAVAAGRPVDRIIRLRPLPRSTGRSELVLGGMAYGAFAGVGLGEVAGAGDNTIALLLAGAGGIGAGFLAAWLTTDDAIKVGHASMMSGGTVFGTVLGGGLSLGFGLSTRNAWAATLLGGGLGLGTGFLVARWDDTSPGDAAVVNSGGGWGAIAGALVAEAIGFHAADQDRALGFLSAGGCAVGLVAGAVFAHLVEVNRGHVAVVDVGGIAGLAIGFGVGYLRGGNDSGVQTGSQYGLGGMALGLLTAAILARNYKDDLKPAEALIARVDGRWRLGMPRASFSTAAVTGNPGARELRVGLTLAKGEF